jgi:hypothetical protein
MGSFGIIYAVALAVGIEKKSSTYVLTWLFFQWFSIVHQIYISIIFLDVLQDLVDNENLRKTLYAGVFFANLLQVLFFFLIFIIFSNYQEEEKRRFYGSLALNRASRENYEKLLSCEEEKC